MWPNIVRAIGCLVVIAGVASADSWDKKTTLKVGETIQVPGAVLEPGTYVIKLMESQSFRGIVTIMNEREDKVYTTIIAIPNYRLKPTDNTAFAWWEVPAGNPRALRAWFYPGDNFGQEFAYPKGLAVKIARQAHTAVPTAEAAKVEELPAAPVTAVTDTGAETPLVAEAYKAPEPEAVTEELADTAELAPAPQAPPAALPKTASPFPLFGLGGGIALLAGAALRAFAGRA